MRKIGKLPARIVSIMLAATLLLQDGMIRYTEVFPSVDYQYTMLGDSLKEDIILLEDTGVNSFSYTLYTDGLKEELKDNQILLYEPESAQEEAGYLLEAPEMQNITSRL